MVPSEPGLVLKKLSSGGPGVKAVPKAPPGLLAGMVPSKAADQVPDVASTLRPPEDAEWAGMLPMALPLDTARAEYIARAERAIREIFEQIGTSGDYLTTRLGNGRPVVYVEVAALVSVALACEFARRSLHERSGDRDAVGALWARPFQIL